MCFCVHESPATDWQPVQRAPRLSPCDSWYRVQAPNDKDKDGCVHKITVIVFANVHHSCFSASCVGLQVLNIKCDTLTQSHQQLHFDGHFSITDREKLKKRNYMKIAVCALLRKDVQRRLNYVLFFVQKCD